MAVLINVKSKQEIVRQITERLADVDSSEQADATIKIIDEPGGHYLLFNNTWKDGRRYYGCFLHLDLSADGKIWIQHDGTDLNVAEQLMEAGIEKEKLFWGFSHLRLGRCWDLGRGNGL